MLKVQDKPHRLPRTIFLQYDNASDQKNKSLFTWASLLIENRYFDVIEINFLIVGHTHTSIDRTFSVVSSAIAACRVILTPLAMIAMPFWP